MCLVCIDLIKQNMTILEAERNLGELIATPLPKKLYVHYKDLLDSLEKLDVEMLETFLRDDRVAGPQTKG